MAKLAVLGAGNFGGTPGRKYLIISLTGASPIDKQGSSDL